MLIGMQLSFLLRVANIKYFAVFEFNFVYEKWFSIVPSVHTHSVDFGRATAITWCIFEVSWFDVFGEFFCQIFHERLAQIGEFVAWDGYTQPFDIVFISEYFI